MKKFDKKNNETLSRNDNNNKKTSPGAVLAQQNKATVHSDQRNNHNFPNGLSISDFG